MTEQYNFGVNSKVKRLYTKTSDMTEKRFTQIDEDDWEILDRGKHFAYAHSGYQAEKIIDELNELVDTNRELYRENEQLRQHKENVIKEFQLLLEFIRSKGLTYGEYEEFKKGGME